MGALNRETEQPNNGNGKDRLGALRETAATLTPADWDWHEGLEAFQALCAEFGWDAQEPKQAKERRCEVAEHIDRMDLVKPWSGYAPCDFEDLMAGARAKHGVQQDRKQTEVFAPPTAAPEPEPETQEPQTDAIRIITITVGYSRKVSANYQSVEAHAGATVECNDQDAHATFAAAYELVRREVETQLNDTSTERN